MGILLGLKSSTKVDAYKSMQLEFILAVLLHNFRSVGGTIAENPDMVFKNTTFAIWQIVVTVKLNFAWSFVEWLSMRLYPLRIR